MPAPATNLVGRTAELDALRELLHLSYPRRITLSGPGGTGKTRLALAVAAEVLADYPQGVCFVALESITNPAFVLPAIAQALGVQESASQPLAQALQTALQDKKILLVLDNFEQVAAAAEAVACLLDNTKWVRVLATSRVSRCWKRFANMRRNVYSKERIVLWSIPPTSPILSSLRGAPKRN